MVDHWDTVQRRRERDISRHSSQRQREGESVRSAHRQHETLGAPDTFHSVQHYHEIPPIRQHAPQIPLVQPGARDSFHLAQQYDETPPRGTYQHNHVDIPPIRQHAPQTPLVQPGARDSFHLAQQYDETPWDINQLNDHVDIPPVRQHAPQTPLVQPGARDSFHLAQQYDEIPVIRQHTPEPETPPILGSTDAFHFTPHYHNEAPTIRQRPPNTPLIQPGDAIHLAQRHETPLVRSRGHEPFANAHDFIMINPVFNDTGTYNNYPGEPGK